MASVAGDVLEVEAKVRLDDPKALRRRLKELGAEPLGRGTQEDRYFRHPVRDFAKTDEALRLRRAGGKLELTYKGPRQGGALKVRTETTVQVDKDPTALLQALGFQDAFTVEKKRETYGLPGVEVAVDRVEGLGWFCEVEAAAGGKDAAARVEGCLRELGLGEAPREARSYLEMLHASRL